MKSLIFLLTFICLAFAKPRWHQLQNYTFEQYIVDFNKNYEKGTEEYELRKEVFKNKLAQINYFNYHTNSTYKQGVNKFSDSHKHEFTNYVQGLSKGIKSFTQIQDRQKLFLAPEPTKFSAEDLAKLPQSVDWRQKGVVTPVKDQGMCGSCWAFSVTEVTESHAALASGKLLNLSAQQIVSCVQNPYQCGGSGGCNGAVETLGYNYIQLYGFTTEENYPYTSGAAGKTGKCLYNEKTMTPSVQLDGYIQLPINSYGDLMNAVANVGPISVSVDASNWSDYEEGIYDGCSYSQNIDINHAVVLVGYGSDTNGDYWLVRNSWTSEWGEQGYIRLRRESTPLCGTDSTVADGSACQGQTQPQKVCGQCGVLSGSCYPLGVRVLQ